MINYDLQELKDKVDSDLIKQLVSGRTLLDRLRVLNEDSRQTAAYLDPNYIGFYYHLGKHIEPETVLEIGFTLGLLSASFFTSCKTSKNFIGFKEKKEEFVPLRMGKTNIHLRFKGKADFYTGSLYDEDFVKTASNLSLVIVNDEVGYDKHLEYLDVVWPKMSEYGLLIAEYIDKHVPAKEAFFAFCKSKNRKPILFSTRYGTGIVQK